MKSNGFTLIELLAVIVILAIIALIASPIIIGLIDDARKEAFKDSAYGIIKAGELLYANDMMNGVEEEVTFTYTDGVETPNISGKKLDYNGEKPKSGKIIVNKEGKVTIAIHNGKFCARKGFGSDEIVLSDLTIEDCTIETPVQYFTFNSATGAITAYDINGGTEVTIPESIDDVTVTAIGSKAFSNKNLMSISIPNTVTSLGGDTFSNNHLTNVIIPNGITQIGSYVFNNNDLTSVELPDSLTYIGNDSFSNNKLTTVTIPNSVTQISANAFNNNQLVSVTIPNSVTYIGMNAFALNNLGESDVILGTGYPQYWVYDMTDYTMLDGHILGGNNGVAIIPEGITNIDTNAFRSTDLISVTIPNSVTNIGYMAFENNKLTTVTIPDSVTSMSGYAFAQNKITSVTLSSNLISIPSSSFTNNKITSIVFPEGITTIESNAFSNNLLTAINLPTSLTKIQDHAFYNNQLTSVTVPNNVTIIERSAFAGNNLNETDVTLGTGFDHFWLYNTSNPTQLDGHILGGENGALIIPDGITAISASAFANSDLNTVSFPNSLRSIFVKAFEYNELTSVNIPEGVVDIYDGAFANNKLTSITLPTTLKTLRTGRGGTVLSNNQLTSITILSPDVVIGSFMLTNNELFKNAYLEGGPGTYIGTQKGSWTKQ